MLRARSYALLGRSGEASEALREAADVRAGPGPTSCTTRSPGSSRSARPRSTTTRRSPTCTSEPPAPAIESARESLSLYASGDPENRSYGCESMASAHLAIAHLMEGDATGAEGAMAPILALPPDRRIGSLGTTLGTGRALLASRPGGEQMARQIEGFCAVGLPQQARHAISDRRRDHDDRRGGPPSPARRRGARRVVPEAGLDTGGATLMRDFANAVYHLAAEEVVVRLAEATTPGKFDRLVTSVRVTRWLAEQGFPTVRPLDIKQPVVAEGFLATFWHHEEHIGPPPDPAQLGPLLRRLHDLPPVPFDLPTHDPFGAVRRAIGASVALDDDDRAGCSTAARRWPRPTTSGWSSPCRTGSSTRTPTGAT